MKKITLKVGDVVRLKSGGPMMNVTEVHDDKSYDDRRAFCIWLKNDGEYSGHEFPIDCLSLVKEEGCYDETDSI